jgi:hypothetical protein
MTDDVLSSFIDAYRAEHSARSLDRRALRDRVVAAARGRRVRRLERVRLILPFAATFVGSLALAATPPVRERVREAFSFVRSGEVARAGPKAPRASAGRRVKPAVVAAPLAIPEPVLAAPAPEIVETPSGDARPLEQPFARVRPERPKVASVGPTTPAPAPAGPSVTAPPPSASFAVEEPAPAASVARRPPPAPSADLALYRRAHELHFGGADRSRALAAWDTYLRTFPRGTFAPEARLNRAVCLAKLGRKAEAEGVLTDIERGRFGKDGRRQAQKILGALDGDD